MRNAKDSALPERIPVRTQTGFGEFVRSSRIRSGKTQEDLAGAVGKSRRWLQDVERGKVAPSLPAAIDVANALGYEFIADRSIASNLLDEVFEDLA
ncbi:helix-turn-helix transcriptional regulator [Leucobacter albus]|uniref:Helix-turn-helix transcriptional regulator n=1 Tax=Leucobacter albus TaxID=272210 RepID=A0ABW3TKN3_9MICO